MALSNKDKIILKAKAQLELRTRTAEPSLIERGKQAITKGFQVSPGVQKAAQLAQVPIRAGRAAAVGIERATRGVGSQLGALALPGGPVTPTGQQALGQVAAQAPQAIERAGAAFKQGFEPQDPRERVAATAGEIGAISLATFPILARAKHPAVTGGLTFSTLEAINQAANEGRIEPIEVGKEFALGASLPLVAPSAALVVKGTKSVLKGILKTSTRLPEKALDTVLDNPKLLKEFAGTQKEISKRVVNLQKAIVQSRQRAGGVLQKVKKKLGVDRPLEAPIRETPTRTPTELDSAFNQAKVLSNSNAPKKEKILALLDLRQELDDMLSFAKPGQTVTPISGRVESQLVNRRNEINTILNKIAPRLRKAEAGFAKTAQTYDEIQRAIATPGKAEDLMVRLFKGENLDEVLGSKKDLLQALRKVEGISKQKLIEPIMKELASKSLRVLEPQGLSGSILAAVAAALAIVQRPGLAGVVALTSSPRGAAAILPAAQRVGRGVRQVGKAVSDPRTRALIAGGLPSAITESLLPREEGQ